MKIQIGFLGALTLIFVVMKLLGYIDWSWWLVFLPALIGFGIGLIVLIVILIIIIVGVITY